MSIQAFRELMETTEDFTCLLADHPRYTYAVSNQIRAVDGAPHRICGEAVTVRTRGVHLNCVIEAIDGAPAGSVIVIDSQGSMNSAFLGDRLAARAAARGVLGVVIDGCCRDVEGLKRIGFPVFARGSVPAPAPFTDGGYVNVPVQCGGAVVQPGDLVAADRNGVVVCPRAGLEGLLAAVGGASGAPAGGPYSG